MLTSARFWSGWRGDFLTLPTDSITKKLRTFVEHARGRPSWPEQRARKTTIMPNEDYYVHRLEHRGIRPTAMRLLILRHMDRGDQTVSLPELERILPTVDKSTISRTLSLFLLHRLIHAVDDGTGSLKYAPCADDCDCSVEDEHTHFCCEQCHRTFCLKQIAVPVVALPEGFTLQSVNYVLKGLCPECSERMAARRR